MTGQRLPDVSCGRGLAGPEKVKSAHKSHLPQRPAPDEARLEEAVKQLAGAGPESCTPEEWASLCEQLRLQALYPGQYVAWRDDYQGEGPARRLLRREVLCASRNAAEVRAHVARLPDNELIGVFIDYVEGPGEPVSGR